MKPSDRRGSRPTATKRPTASPSAERKPNARQVALEVLRRIEVEGAYANLALGPALQHSQLGELDRKFATELVYGTTRMRRACDSLVDRFIASPPDAATRSVLRLGAYQLAYAGVPPHAAVGETVGLAPKRTRGLVNAVLRKVSRLSIDEQVWPSDGARLSYPDWIVDVFRAEIGDGEGNEWESALARMNEAPTVTQRPDGYTQDESSQWVAANVEARPGERIFDVCAAPGGKATALAGGGAGERAIVIAGDQRPARARLVRDNAAKLDLPLPVVVADGAAPPFAPGQFDAVLLDAPCSGLGALRRRADARWRITANDVVELADLQRRLLASAAELIRPGGRLIYSVCTITAAESIDHPVPAGFEVDTREPTTGTWRPFGHGWRVLPQDADTDGMVLVRYRRSA